MDQTRLTYEACSQCRLSRSKCVFLERRPESKDDLRRQIEELRNQEEQREVVFKGLASAEHSGWILKALWRHEPIRDIASRLSKGLLEDDSSPCDDAKTKREDATSVSPELRQPTNLDTDPNDTAASSLPGPEPLEHDLQNLSTSETTNHDSNAAFAYAQKIWGLSGLNVPQLRELLEIFFEYQYIPFFFINKSLFLRDFLSGSDEHCSKALLRSIICVACRLQGGYDAPYSFYVNLGDRCFDELESCLNKPGSFRFCVADAQSLGLAALHDLGCGSKIKSIELAEDAVRRLDAARKQQDPETTRKAFPTLKATLVGAINLAWVIRTTVEWSRSNLGSQASTPATETTPIGPPEPDASLEELFNTLGKEQSSESDLKPLPALGVQLASDVYRIQSRANAASSKDEDLPQDLKETFQRCLYAYKSILAFTKDSPDDGVTQSTLHFMHVFYHFCLLVLLRPYCHLQTTDSNLNPREICLEAAQAILSLSKSYDHHTAKRLVPCFVPLFVYTASKAIVELLGDGRGTSRPTTTPSSMVISPTTPGLSSIPTPSFKQEDMSREQSGIEVSPMGVSLMPGHTSTAEVINHLASMEDAFPIAREVKKGLEEMHARPTSQDQAD